MLNIDTGVVLPKLIDIGYQTGPFESSKLGPAASEELGERAGPRERYVREWLGAMATSGIYSYASGGAGLGKVWGHQTARRMLAEAGFGSVEILDTPRPQNCSCVCRPAAQPG
jgi:hypothetical protein